MRLLGFIASLAVVGLSVAFIESVLYQQVNDCFRAMVYVAGALGLVIAVGLVEEWFRPHRDREPLDPPET